MFRVIIYIIHEQGFVYTGLAMEMLNIMQSRLERMATSKDITSQLMGNFIPILLSVEFSNNIFKNQQRSVIEETPLRFRCIGISIVCPKSK
jgi:hypothetical protein